MTKDKISAAGKAADLLRSATGKKKPKNAAILLAAGASLRMEGISKQFAEVDGLPVIVRSLLAFEQCGMIDEIIAVCREEDRGKIESFASVYSLTKLAAVVIGGETRALSVKNGFEKISNSVEYVAIHDGARCLITPLQIEKVLRAAHRYKAASAAYPVVDTVKIADGNGFISSTTRRDRTFCATTPQIFHADLYRAALATVEDYENLTDDNQLIEKLPYPVKLVDCGRENIKITYPQDLKLAEFLLMQRKEKE